MSQGTLTKQDFVSSVDVKWCPGCGDYAILSAIQSTMPHIGIPKEKIVFISGIGCSSRFPHYMGTYGFHTIHGRAPAVATGLRMANPDLSVWLITGDGDGLSIGGNHLLHALKRNVDLKILLFNNNIYGLTKGQVSPTSAVGTVTKSSPLGSVDDGLVPCTFAISAGASFVARTMDKNPKHMQEVFTAASKHPGAAFNEILQNCVIFNNGVHDHITKPDRKTIMQLHLEAGKPMLFNEGKQGIRFNSEQIALEAVTIGENGITESDIMIHNPSSTNKALQVMIAELGRKEGEPVAFGIIRNVEIAGSYESLIHQQMADYQEKKGTGNLQKLINSGDTWTIE